MYKSKYSILGLCLIYFSIFLLIGWLLSKSRGEEFVENASYSSSSVRARRFRVFQVSKLCYVIFSINSPSFESKSSQPRCCLKRLATLLCLAQKFLGKPVTQLRWPSLIFSFRASATQLRLGHLAWLACLPISLNNILYIL